MREWIVRLNTIDGGAAEALRVIEHFDTLVDQRSSAMAMLRAAAALANCPCGLEDPDRGLRVGVDASGRAVAKDADDAAGATARRTECFEEITVWLDRDGPPQPLDHLILERFARSLHAVKKARDVSPVVAARRLACDPEASPADRDAAVRQLGLGSTVTVVVTHVADARRLPAGLVVDDLQVHLFPATAGAVVGAPAAIPLDIAAGLCTCPATDVHRGWQNAATALRIAVDLTTCDPTHVHYEHLGAIATIVDSIDPDTAAHAPDVRRMTELQAQRPWVVPTLEAILSHTSIREAARVQNLHHSTMRQRIDWLERQLGYNPLGDGGFARAGTTLTLWRIAMAAAGSRRTETFATAACR